MAEAGLECLRESRSPGVPTRLVTRSAGRNVAPVSLRAPRVTLIARRVRIESRRDGKGHAPARRFVAGRAPDVLVARVVERHIEAFERRELLDLVTPRFNVSVADRAYRTAGSAKLLRMTPRTRRVYR